MIAHNGPEFVQLLHPMLTRNRLNSRMTTSRGTGLSTNQLKHSACSSWESKVHESVRVASWESVNRKSCHLVGFPLPVPEASRLWRAQSFLTALCCERNVATSSGNKCISSAKWTCLLLCWPSSWIPLHKRMSRNDNSFSAVLKKTQYCQTTRKHRKQKCFPTPRSDLTYYWVDLWSYWTLATLLGLRASNKAS